MTTRKGSRKSVKQREIEPETEDMAQEETLFDGIVQEAFVNVYRRNESSMKWDFQFRLPPDRVDLAYIQELRGGGDYRLVERVPTEEGKTVYGRQRTVHIDGPPKRLANVPAPDSSQKAKSSATVPVSSSGGVGMDDVMTAGLMQIFEGMARASEMQTAVMSRMLETRQPSVDWGVVLSALAPVLAKLVDRPEPPNSLDQIEKVANVLASQQKGTAGLTDTIESIMAVFDLKKEISSEGSGDPLLDLAAKNLPGLIEIMKSGQQAGQTPQQIRQAAAAALESGDGAKGTVPLTKDENVPMWQRLLSQWGPRLVDQAQKDVDPEASAKVLLGNIPDVFKGALRQFLYRPDAEQILYQVVPQLSEYREWTEEFFGVIVAEFGIDDDSETDGEMPLMHKGEGNDKGQSGTDAIEGSERAR